MALKTVNWSVRGPDGSVKAGAQITVKLSQPATLSGTSEVVPSTVILTTDSTGAASAQLQANNDLTPTGTFYSVTEAATDGGTFGYTMVVPQTAGPFSAASIMTGVAPTASPGVGHLSSLTVDAGLTVTAGPVSLPAASLSEANVANLTSDLAAKANDAAVVHLAGAETITGVKTFTSAPVVPAGAFPESAVANLVTDLGSKATDASVVHLAGAETVTGIKTFSANPVLNAGALPLSAVTGAAADSAVVHLAGAETISGLKTFSAGLTVSAGSVTLPANSIADTALSTNVVLLTGAQTISGAKTFSAVGTFNSGINVGTNASLDTSGNLILASKATQQGSAVISVGPIGVANPYPNAAADLILQTQFSGFVRIRSGNTAPGYGQDVKINANGIFFESNQPSGVFFDLPSAGGNGQNAMMVGGTGINFGSGGTMSVGTRANAFSGPWQATIGFGNLGSGDTFGSVGAFMAPIQGTATAATNYGSAAIAAQGSFWDSTLNAGAGGSASFLAKMGIAALNAPLPARIGRDLLFQAGRADSNIAQAAKYFGFRDDGMFFITNGGGAAATGGITLGGGAANSQPFTFNALAGANATTGGVQFYGGGASPSLVASIDGSGKATFNGGQVLAGAAPTAAAGQVALGGTTAASATAGASGAPPAQVLGYLIANVAGTAVKIPYYAN